jgi:hypothetical protein
LLPLTGSSSLNRATPRADDSQEAAN